MVSMGLITVICSGGELAVIARPALSTAAAVATLRTVRSRFTVQLRESEAAGSRDGMGAGWQSGMAASVIVTLVIAPVVPVFFAVKVRVTGPPVRRVVRSAAWVMASGGSSTVIRTGAERAVTGEALMSVPV